jgi:hypothetical protein
MAAAYKPSGCPRPRDAERHPWPFRTPPEEPAPGGGMQMSPKMGGMGMGGGMM